jgi:glyoxylase-like metal-dependent hydrolase (beta-lactamase superfamily II)
MPVNQLTVGNVTITALSDGMLEFDLCNFFPGMPVEDWQPHQHHLTDDGKLRFNLGSYLLRTDGRTVLVDTGMGPRLEPDNPWGKLLQALASHGLSPNAVDLVVLTHAHRDHVGWNLQSDNGKYRPTFPNARYYLSALDWETCHNPEVVSTRFPNAPQCVWPLAELGVLELMRGEQALTSELTSLPTPGHTPGHTSIMVNSQGERAIIMGDTFHNPAQVVETGWISRADMDPAQTRRTRDFLLDRFEREGATAVSGHFPAPGFGRIVRLEGRRYWQAR